MSLMLKLRLFFGVMNFTEEMILDMFASIIKWALSLLFKLSVLMPTEKTFFFFEIE